ncbi:MAG: RDD family protein [Lachnospiraceae bacterium]|nr:RDD family protein [Lachnospiraceae bacterium]
MEYQGNNGMCPWRRYLARGLDLSICGLMWNAVFMLVLHGNPARGDIRLMSQVLNILAGMGLMLLAEPWLLHWFGTTPGKAVFGIRICREDGDFLTVRQGFARTWQVIRDGQGFQIPIYSWIRLYKSYRTCAEDGKMPWDYQMIYTVKEPKWYRWLLYAAGEGAVFAGLIFIILAAEIPPNRGELTVAEFAENYNFLSDYYGYHSNYRLAPDGSWEENPEDNTVVVMEVLDLEKRPEFAYEIEAGVLVGLSFQLEGSEDDMIYSRETQMLLSALAYAGSQKGISVLGGERQRIVKEITQSGWKSFACTLGDVSVSCVREQEGYHEMDGYFCLIPDESARRRAYRMVFEMRKTGKEYQD